MSAAEPQITVAPLDAALLNFAYWPEVRRGNERLVHDVATELARAGHEASIITSHPGKPTESIEDGVRVIRNHRPPDLPLRLRRFQDHLTHLPATLRSLKRLQPQVAHAFFPSDALAATHWARRNNGVAVTTFTGIPGRENVANVRLRKRILEEITARSDAIVVISQAARDATWRWLAIEPEVIYPGVDTELFRPRERASVPTIACAADPGDQRKRVGLLVGAFRLVRRERPDAELLLVRPSDEAMVQELKDEQGVRLFAGDEETAPRMLAEAWVSALCSYREAFGLVVVESLACGTPVVASSSGAMPEIVDRPEVGALFEEPDEKEVARLLLEQLERNGDTTTAEACRSRAQDFSSERCGAAHESLYRRLVGTDSLRPRSG